MPYFVKSGKKFTVAPKEAMDLHERLPVDTYTVGLNECSGQYYLEAIENFQIEGKLYGKTTQHADRILRTFLDRTAPTGVLLAGEKGSGKTLLAKLVSIKAANLEIPTIVINRGWCGEDFNAFLQIIEQPAVILFDEFEKVYKPSDQEKMLTLLDGVYPSKKLFILTCNDKWRVNDNMQNRPGRIYYMLDFESIELDFIKEYCEDNLDKKHHINKICAASAMFSKFNFDMLKAMVEEINRYNENPSEVLKYLNARPEFSQQVKYVCTLHVGDKKLTREDGIGDWHGNPLAKEVVIHYYDNKSHKNKNERFTPRDLQQLDARRGIYAFTNENGSTLVLTPAINTFKFDCDELPRVKTIIGDGPSETIDLPMAEHFVSQVDNGDY